MSSSLSIGPASISPAQTRTEGERRGYTPIADHGVIGDLRTVALVATDGTIDWYCPEAFDSPSVFATILDRERGGRYQISALHEAATKQLCLPDTNVLITRFLSPDGVGELQDFMPVGGEQRLIRRAVCVRGSMRFRLECEPRFNYGRDRHATALSAGGARLRSPSLTLALGTSVPLRQTAAGVTAEFELRAGETTTFVLTDDDDVRACQGGCRGAPARGHRRVLAELDLPVPLRRAVARDRQPLGPGN